MTIMLALAWLWLLGGLGGMVVTSPNLLVGLFRLRFWQKEATPDAPPRIVAWGGLRLHIILFWFCFSFFGLGLVGLLGPPTAAGINVVTVVGLAAMPFLLIYLAIAIAHDERHIVEAPRREH